MKDIKNLILYFYNMNVENIVKKNNNYSFYNDYNLYYLIKCLRPKDDINAIYTLLNNYKTKYNIIIKNKFNNIITEVKKQEYVLVKVTNPIHEEMDIFDIIKNQIPVQNYKVLDRSNYGNLWQEKVDYLEYQVSELGTNYDVLKKSFNYYVGLAENAIHYFNLLNTNNKNLVISSKRLYYPCYKKDYFNPLNIIIDYKVREISEYIKSAFFESINVIEIINKLIDLNILNGLEYNILYARLLFPTYYFDKVGYILEFKKNEEELYKYINKVKEYENFLIEVYKLLNKKTALIAIDWLNG